MEPESSNDHNGSDWQQAGHDAEDIDLAGPGAHGKLECDVGKPQKEGEGTQNAYISYLVITQVRLHRAQRDHELTILADRLQIISVFTL